MAGIRITAAQAYPTLPSIDDDIAALIDKVNFAVEKYILKGFNYKVNDKVYHFSFDDQDQANFTQELLRAVNVAAQGQDAVKSYTARWRGHDIETGVADTLSLDINEFNKLAMYAGTWKARVLSHGWDVKNILSGCKKLGELDALDRYYRISEIYLAARDGDEFNFITEDGVDPLDAKGDGPRSLDTPKLTFNNAGETPDEVVGAEGDTFPINLVIGESKEDPATQFHLHMFAYECKITNFHTHETYGPGEGEGFDGTLEELREWCKNASVIVGDKYGYVDISLYPVSAGGLESVNFYVTPDNLPPREGKNPLELNEPTPPDVATVLPATDSVVTVLPEGVSQLDISPEELMTEEGTLNNEMLVNTIVAQSKTISWLQQRLAALSMNR